MGSFRWDSTTREVRTPVTGMFGAPNIAGTGTVDWVQQPNVNSDQARALAEVALPPR